MNLPSLPRDPGVYLMRDNTGKIIYIGKARNLRQRVASYFSPTTGDPQPVEGKIRSLVSLVRQLDYIPTSSERGALVLERRLIHRYQPVFNTMWKDDKSYPYLALTMGEDFPRLFLTRQKKNDGTLYFGPYPSVSSVRSLLRWIWRRKLFPLRPCELEFDEKKLPDYRDVKSCLYLHTEQCPAPCVGKIKKSAYRRIAEKARWFFEGKQRKMTDSWEKEMRQHAKAMRFEEAASVRNRIETISHMGERVLIKEVDESHLDERLRESRAVQDLRHALGLKNAPVRIECFDISHFQGAETVASMVQFVHGRPNKSEYRRFIIRGTHGIDDFQSMLEVVERRYRRLAREKRDLPDLVLIDGGKGQLNAALKAFERLSIRNIPVAALAKREEEVFVPNRNDSLGLAADSPGVLLLRHVRDEAHRFALSFHRQRRDKNAFQEEKSRDQ